MDAQARRRNQRLIGKPCPTNYDEACVVARAVLREGKRAHSSRRIGSCEGCDQRTGWYCRDCMTHVCDDCTKTGRHACFADPSILPAATA